MNPFRWIRRLVSGLWSFSRASYIDVGRGLRPGSRASGLFIFLFLIFFLIGLVLVLLGFDLVEIDNWIETQSGWLDAVGTILFRIVCGLVVLLAGFTVWGAIFNRKDPNRPGFGCAIGAIIIGYFAWFGVIG